MDDAGRVNRSRRTFACVLLAGVAAGLSGCSLFVMAGKMIFGDPQVTAPFKHATGLDLPRSHKKVLVVSTAASVVGPEVGSLRYDLTTLVARRLKRSGIRLIDENRVAGWMDDNGGVWTSEAELAQAFDADYIVHIDVESFTYRVPSSPELYRSEATGTVTAWEVITDGEGGRKRTERVFNSRFVSQYPEHNPAHSSEISSERVFVRRAVDRMASRIAQMFFDHPYADEMW
ncbi:MAG: hypothetical protein KY476_21210 [Planctomycetes bacterium]|nr:hypothetical protein [Planctomycetota bacterium]